MIRGIKFTRFDLHIHSYCHLGSYNFDYILTAENRNVWCKNINKGIIQNTLFLNSLAPYYNLFFR